MTPTMELEAKNVEQAIQKACDQLKISRDNLKYNVISYGSTGIFGLGRTKKARIRVTLPDKNPETVTETKDIQHTDLNNDGDVKRHVQSLIQDTFSPKQTQTFPDTARDLGMDVLQRIIDSITSDARIIVEEDPERILFKVKGGNSAVLIGKHGQTLEAIQSLVEKIVNKHNSDRIRVQVDVEGYLENRKNNLIRQAERLARKCKKIRKPVTVGYMNAYDRRIVHLALKNDNEVSTQSLGEGLLRKLMIFPKKNSYQKRRYR
jgi:spoIIIJ-associated protein